MFNKKSIEYRSILKIQNESQNLAVKTDNLTGYLAWQIPNYDFQLKLIRDENKNAFVNIFSFWGYFFDVKSLHE